MNPEITRPESVKNANLPIGPDASSGPVRAIHGELRSVLRLESKFDPSRTRAFLSIAIKFNDESGNNYTQGFLFTHAQNNFHVAFPDKNPEKHNYLIRHTQNKHPSR